MILETQDQLEELLEGIQMVGTRFEDWRFDWKITPVEEPVTSVEFGVVTVHGKRLVGWHLQSSFERPDANDPGADMGVGYGRKWFVEVGTPDTGVIFTAWMAVQQIIIHELHEAFTVNVKGERVRLLDPHKNLVDLAVGSRKV